MDAEYTNEVEKMKSNLFDQVNETQNFFLRFPKIMKSLNIIPYQLLKHPDIERIKRDESFDLVVFGWFMNDFQLGLAAHFKCPAVIVSTVPASKTLRDFVGNPSEIFITPNPFLGQQTEPFTFMKRLISFGIGITEFVAVHLFEYLVTEPYYVDCFPPDKYPSFSEVKKNISLVLAVQHFSQLNPSSSFPALVEVSGMHIKPKPDPLPEVLILFY